MLNFFVPETKVQKDRAVMRETDARMAKYSRRGLVLNFLVFLLCVLFGQFEQEFHNTAIVLVTGLLLVTLGRGYFLFRFSTLYARAPTRWRNQYFFASCLGAAWWSAILVSLTWLQGMQGETLVMWFYSVVFYSTVANVFAPYRKFLTIYLAIGQVPAAITAILLGDTSGVFYGCIMLAFYIMISHQGNVTCQAYWERLEANFLMRERAQGLEEEKRNSQAQLELKNEFLVNLGQEFRSSISDVIGTLALIDESKLSEQHRELLKVSSNAAGRQIDLVNNVVDFSKITARTLSLESIEFDLRRVLEKNILDFSLDAYQQGIEVYPLLAPDMPLRVKGDMQRMNQILNVLMSYALKASRLDHIYMEARFEQANDTYGHLQWVIRNSAKADDEAEEGESRESNYRGIGLAISKGLAECMDGSVYIREEKNRGLRVFIRLGLQVVAHEEARFGSEHKFTGKELLLVDWPEHNAQALAAELAVWGLHVRLAYGHDELFNQLQNHKTDVLLMYTRLGNMKALALSAEIAADERYGQVEQILAMSGLQIETPELKRHLRLFSQVVALEKPVIRKRLYDLLQQRLLNNGNRLAERELRIGAQRVLLLEEQRVDQMVVSAMLKKMGCSVHLVQSSGDVLGVLADERFDFLLMDFDFKEQENLALVKKIRAQEVGEREAEHVPVIALTSRSLENDGEFLQAGIDDYIAKPVRAIDLEQCLLRWADAAKHRT